MAERGVASVALTQESVFASREAGELLALLRAWAEPASEARLRAALVTELAGVDAGELLSRVEDETRWEAQLQANAADHLLWRERGFMAAWRHFFARERVAERLLPLPDGERRLTNLSHLAELLQQESDSRQGMAPLLAWLEARVAQPPGGEEAVLRLESDAALVKIVTIHTAKGLQYPVAFCPFLWGGALERRDTAFWRYHAEEQSWLAPDVAADADVRLAARSELLAEKLRLLYVALTRAQYRQYLCWGWVRGMETAALSWLLHGRDARGLPQLEQLELDAGVVRRQLDGFVAAANAEAGAACAVLEGAVERSSLAAPRRRAGLPGAGFRAAAGRAVASGQLHLADPCAGGRQMAGKSGPRCAPAFGAGAARAAGAEPFRLSTRRQGGYLPARDFRNHQLWRRRGQLAPSGGTGAGQARLRAGMGRGRL